MRYVTLVILNSLRIKCHIRRPLMDSCVVLTYEASSRTSDGNTLHWSHVQSPTSGSQIPAQSSCTHT